MWANRIRDEPAAGAPASIDRRSTSPRHASISCDCARSTAKQARPSLECRCSVKIDTDTTELKIPCV